MALRKLMFILVLLFCVFKIKCEVSPQSPSNTFQPSSTEINAVIDYLNSIPVRVYNYKQGVLRNAHKKADITELTLDVYVDCVNVYPNLPCNDKVLICNAFVQNPAEGVYTVLSDVKCNPKPHVIIDEPRSLPESNLNENIAPEVKQSVALSNEAVSSEASDHFVAVRKNTVPCLGCPFDLSNDAEGVDELVDLALKHVESEKSNKHTLVKVLQLQQQIVSGVKYILTAELAPTVCSKDSIPLTLDACPRDSKAKSLTCQVTYIQKPWINKAKHIINNNCTQSQEYVTADDINNEIDVSEGKFKPGEKHSAVDDPNFDQIAESGSPDQMTPSRLADLESQILFGEAIEIQPAKPTTTQDQLIKNNDEINPNENIEQVKPVTDDNVPVIEEFIVPDAAPSGVFQGAFPSYAPVNFPTGVVEEAPSTIFNPEPQIYETPQPTYDTINSQSEPFTIFLTTLEDFQSDAPEATVTPDAEASSTQKPEIVSSTAKIDESTSKKPDQSSSDSSSESKGSSEEKTGEQKNKSSENKGTNEKDNKSSEESDESGEKTSKAPPKQKRAVRQLEKISPDEKNLVKHLADYAAAALDYMDDDNHKRMVLQILGAKKMVVDDGVYYHLILRMGISKCLEDKEPSPGENCRDKLLENYTKICKVQVHVNDEFGSPKVVKSQCQNIKRDKNDSNRTNYSRFRRAATLVGAPNSIDKENPKIKEFLAESITHLDLQSSSDKRLKPVEVLSATSQVVAGALYKVRVKIALSDCGKNEQKELDSCNVPASSQSKICEIKTWEKLWEHFRQHTIKCDDDKEKEYKFEVTVRRRREVPKGVKGAPISVPFDKISDFVTNGLAHIDSKSEHKNKHKLHKFISATQQTVAGTLYKINGEIVLSDCLKTDDKKHDDCNQLEGAQPKVCEFAVWDRPWLPNGRETNITCDDSSVYSYKQRRRRDIPTLGGESELPKTEAFEHLKGGLDHLDSKSEHKNKYKVHEIISATQQVVSGSLYKIKAKIVLSDCLKTDTTDRNKCNKLENAESKTCDFEIWDQPWLPKGRKTNITCEDNLQYTYRERRDVNLSRHRRSVGIPGGQFEIPHSEVFEFLNGGLDHIDSKSEQKNKYKIHEVISATKQVVSGSLYRIKAKVILSDCLKTDQTEREKCNKLENAEPKVCDFQIWDQPWLPNGRETNITCDDSVYSFRQRRRRDVDIPTLGGESELPKTEALQYVNTGLSHLDSKSEHTNKYKVHEIISATQQVVSGSAYKIKAKIVLSDCLKTDSTERDKCKNLENAAIKTCDFKIWDQSWLPKGRETNITCEDNSHYSFRQRRDLSSHPLDKDIEYLHFIAFQDFIEKYDKKYSDDLEFKYRFKVFRDNLDYINFLNSYERGTAKYGITQFADLSAEEFSRSHGLRRDLKRENDIPPPNAKIPDIELPTEFDWRKKGAVTPVKDQKQCGSCWAFSVTGNVEGQFAIKHGKLLEFSEQELVDCDTEDQGCNGGLMDNAYREIEKLGGLETEGDYPYDAEDEKCHFNRSLARVQLSGAVNISHDETDMAKWLVQNGPISIAINANAMQFYLGGVSHPFKFLCNPNNLDHGVLIVGYGVHKYPMFKKNLPYWIVKNSWGPSWGEQGYYRVYRGDGTCGLNQTPSSAIVA